MHSPRRQLLITGVVAACLPQAQAQPQPVTQAPWRPVQPVRVLVSFPPGGHLDFVMRAIALQLTEALGQPVLIENRPGANGNVAGALAARATPDGLTLLATSSDAIAVNPHLYRADFDPVKDLQPITQLVGLSLMIVAPAGFPANDAQSLIAHLKASGRTLSYATPGIGSSLHLVGEIFQRAAGVKLNHVPYKGLAAAITDLQGGHVDLVFDAGVGLPQVREGKIKLLTIAGPQRLPEFPDVGTLAEAGIKGFEHASSFVLMAPTGTPPAAIERFQAVVAKVLQQDSVQAPLKARNLRSIGNTPAEARAALDAELLRSAQVIREAGIKVE